jgi:RimJ/RimL family protein N-acetyltransferase
LELNRIQARVATGNYPSQAVCERLGLKKEGILRQAEWLYDHFVDLTMNSVLRTEWEGNFTGGKKHVRTLQPDHFRRRTCSPV